MHRDLKLDNIMVADDDRAVVVDFGLAIKVDESGSTELFQYTPPGGNLRHLAPEVLTAASHLNSAPHVRSVSVHYAKQPVFALGVLLWELACGEHPIEEYPGWCGCCLTSLWCTG